MSLLEMINKMKDYTIYFVIKRDGHAYLHQMETVANNQREAITYVRNAVREDTGRHAFHCTTKKPVKTERGLEWDGMIYTKYCDVFHTLW